MLGRQDVKPRHGKSADASDALHTARAAEVTSLWRLGLALDGDIGVIKGVGQHVAAYGWVALFLQQALGQ